MVLAIYFIRLHTAHPKIWTELPTTYIATENNDDNKLYSSII